MGRAGTLLLLSLVCLVTLATSTEDSELMTLTPAQQCSTNITQQLEHQNKKLDNMLKLIESLLQCQGCNEHGVSTPVPNGDYVSDCSKVKVSGVYTIVASGLEFKAYCKVGMDGKWTVIQRREDGSVSFYRKWEAYRLGFGQLTGEHWLGNDFIHALSASGHNRLRIDLEDWGGVKHTVYYNVFHVAGAEDKYRLTLSGFSGTNPPGDDLTYHSGSRFSTQDQDNDSYAGNCAVLFTGAWWFKGCHKTHLNGVYNGTQYGKGVNWSQWKGYMYSLKRTVMMVQ